MGRINLGRVIVGGLVAGLVINVSETILSMAVLGDAYAALADRLGLPDMGGGAMVVYIVMGFLMGIFAVWLYAAMRPRFGPGPRTAILAGLAFWAIFHGLRAVDFMAWGVFPRGLIFTSLIWTLVESPVATVVGAYFYKEET